MAFGLEGLGPNLLYGLLAFGAGQGASRLARLRKNRRLWRLSEPERLIVSVATSALIDTGEYLRPTTGVGQLRALAHVMPSLSRAYSKISIENIRLCRDVAGNDFEHDLICLGGPKNNTTTEDVLERLAGRIPLRVDGTTVYWEAEPFHGETKEGAVTDDYGYIVRAVSPFDSSRAVIVLAGSHTYGSVAAARFFVEEFSRLRWWRLGGFCALVAAPVRQGHTLRPEMVRFHRIGR